MQSGLQAKQNLNFDVVFEVFALFFQKFSNVFGFQLICFQALAQRFCFLLDNCGSSKTRTEFCTSGRLSGWRGGSLANFPLGFGLSLARKLGRIVPLVTLVAMFASADKEMGADSSAVRSNC